MSVRLRPSPLFASVVSTASTRPLYGRGVGSIPAGGSSSHADVAQTEEHRDATPGRPVRAGPSACSKQRPVVYGRTASSNLAGPVPIPGRPVHTLVAGRRGSVIPPEERPCESRAAPCGSNPHPDRISRLARPKQAQQPAKVVVLESRPQGATRDRTARAATTGRLSGSRGRRGSRTTTNPADVAESGYAPASEAGGHRP